MGKGKTGYFVQGPGDGRVGRKRPKEIDDQPPEPPVVEDQPANPDKSPGHTLDPDDLPQKPSMDECGGAFW